MFTSASRPGPRHRAAALAADLAYAGQDNLLTVTYERPTLSSTNTVVADAGVRRQSACGAVTVRQIPGKEPHARCDFDRSVVWCPSGRHPAGRRCISTRGYTWPSLLRMWLRGSPIQPYGSSIPAEQSAVAGSSKAWQMNSSAAACPRWSGWRGGTWIHRGPQRQVSPPSPCSLALRRITFRFPGLPHPSGGCGRRRRAGRCFRRWRSTATSSTDGDDVPAGADHSWLWDGQRCNAVSNELMSLSTTAHSGSSHLHAAPSQWSWRPWSRRSTWSWNVSITSHVPGTIPGRCSPNRQPLWNPRGYGNNACIARELAGHSVINRLRALRRPLESTADLRLGG